jgi:hypothetical protein
MRKEPKFTNCLLQNPASKSFLQASKILVYIDFEAYMRNPNFPQDLASFWEQIPLQMASKSSKNHFLD